MAEEAETTRTTVKTYVPKYQREEWSRHADRLDMSRSEFVRTMVQVGRRDFEVPEGGGRAPGSDPNPDSDGDESGTKGVADALDDQVVAALSDGPLPWEDLLAAVTEGIEDRLDETLQRLQSENRVQYSGRDGGYRLVDDE